MYPNLCIKSFNMTLEWRVHVVYVSAAEWSRQTHLTVSSLYSFMPFLWLLIPTNSWKLHQCLEQVEILFFLCAHMCAYLGLAFKSFSTLFVLVLDITTCHCLLFIYHLAFRGLREYSITTRKCIMFLWNIYNPFSCRGGKYSTQRLRNLCSTHSWKPKVLAPRTCYRTCNHKALFPFGYFRKKASISQRRSLTAVPQHSWGFYFMGFGEKLNKTLVSPEGCLNLLEDREGERWVEAAPIFIVRAESPHRAGCRTKCLLSCPLLPPLCLKLDPMWHWDVQLTSAGDTTQEYSTLMKEVFATHSSWLWD